jgi:hypothetical protein
MAATLQNKGTKPRAKTKAAAPQFAEVPVARPQVEQRTLNLPPSPSFLLKWHPERWGVFGDKWLPILGKLPAEPGVASVNKNGSTSLARAEAERKGWRIIPESAAALADPDRTTYVKAYQGRRGTIHLSIFEHPRQVGNRVIVKTDDEGYRAWLSALIDAGYIDAPDDEVPEAIIDGQRQRVERAIGANNPHRIAREEERLEALQTARTPGDEGDDEPEPEPAPTKRKPGRPKKG